MYVALARRETLHDFGTKVQGLGEGQIDPFIGWLDMLIDRTPAAELSAAIYDTIDAGGYLQDFLSSLVGRGVAGT
jgi:hypothetical protein